MLFAMKSDNEKWSKVLYEKQPFPDNYVPPTFLKDLRKNVNIRYYSYGEIIVNCTAVTQEICSIVVFIVVFMLLKAGQPSTAILVCVFKAVITLILYVTLIVHSKHMFLEFKNGFIFLFGGFTVSPILKTLTETISADTIYTMVTLMMLLHLATYDYGAKAAVVSTSLSLNAAIFAAVCLASQLSTTYHVFALLILASDVFVLFSVIRRQIRENSSKLTKCIVTALLAISALLSLYIIAGTVFSFLLLLTLILVNFVFPYGFYRLQVYKENIYGPWDEAVIQTPSVAEKFNSKSNFNSKKLQ